MVHLNFEQKLEMAREALTSQLKDPTSAMETLDMLQQLGIDYHFSEEIDTITQSLYQIFSTYNDSSISFMDSLQHVALGFRLLRQYGYYTCPDVFSRFMNKQGHFDVALCQDLRGLLSLYEASQMGIGEDILYKANKFSAENLQACIDHVGVEMGKKIKQALEQPIHLSLPRNTTRQYICQLQREHEMNNLFKEVAIMDFNYVQSLHESEFSEVLRWWKTHGLSKQPQFFRDQPMKWYAWTTSLLFEPKFSKIRVVLTKVIALVYVIDDIFDVFGSLEELVLFTEAVERWEKSRNDSLPNYMKLCLQTLHHITNEITNLVLSEHGWNPIDALRTSWASLCKAFLIEAGWFREGITPKTSEYLENGLKSTGVSVILTHFCLLLGNTAGRQITTVPTDGAVLFRLAALSLRLWDDLGSAQDEKQDGFDGSYVYYYMKEHEVSLESAIKHTMEMISDAWKSLNKECLLSNHFSHIVKKAILNSVRMMRVMYTYKNQRLPMLEQYTQLIFLEPI